jgi:hypothetical protein
MRTRLCVALAVLVATLAMLAPEAPAYAAGPVATWSGPTLVDDTAATETHGLSCLPDGTSCVAVDQDGRASVFDPRTGATTVTAIPGAVDLLDVVCVSATRCVAVGPQLVVRFSPGAPRAATVVATPGYWSALECPSDRLCVALGGDAIATLDPSADTAPTVRTGVVESARSLVAVS